MAWKFRQGGKTENPKDAGIKEFSKHIFESVVREATQNALDNRLGDDNPVRIKFEFGSVIKERIPQFNELNDRWKACYEKWKDQAQYEVFIKAILNRIESFEKTVPFLSISDFNTKGMDFTSNPDMDKTRYGAFSRGTHSYHDSDNAAGSEGQGKAALYAVSAMRTMFVHTVSNKGSIYEGLTRFATHEYNGIRYNSDGYYPHFPERPEYEKNIDHSLPFRRIDVTQLGTTITLVGLWAYENAEEKMVKAAINNFWMAVHEGDLIIKIGATELNRGNIKDLIEQYLPERPETNRTKNNPTEYGRAKCYYETWTEVFADETEVYQDNIPVLGNCTLKISQHSEFPGKIAFFRKQKMLIVRSSVNSYINKGYCGVFICKDEDGNMILRKMEGKTHTEWDPNNCMTEDDKIEGHKAIEEMNKFIDKSWKDYRSKHFPDSIDLKIPIDFSRTSVIQKSKGQKKKPEKSKKERKKIEFEKQGIINEGLSSKMGNGLWQYQLTLKSNKDKRVKIEMYPATDSIRLSHDELLEIMSATSGWKIYHNTLEGILPEGEETTIGFTLNNFERVGLDFKLTSNEV